ncbi:MAG: MoaD/ThiS family protein [Pirellulales bacterium]|nr:MoaD/ThiS family protein [Pirellulales bacterium]
MKIQVKLFAAARQWAGADSVELEMSDKPLVADLRRALTSRLPRLEQFGPQLRFAVDSEFADDDTPISAQTEVACIPPVSGG